MTLSQSTLGNFDLSLVKSGSSLEVKSKQIFCRKENTLKVKNNSVFQVLKKSNSSSGSRSIPSKNNLNFFIGNVII